MTTRPRSISPPDDTLALLRALLVKVEALDAKVSALLAARATRGPDPAGVERLLLAIAETIGDGYEWTCGELLEHAALPGKDALRAAIAATVGTDRPGKRLGKMMRAHVGTVVAGLTVTRTRHDREGAHWRVALVR